MPATFDMPERGELDLLAIRSVIFAHAELLSKLPIGVGDMCYAVGIVPTDGRKRPQLAGRSHWEHCPDAGRRTYLVEMQNLKGLSGSPVFVRPSRSIDLSVPGQDSLIFRLGKDNVLLLGVWQSSWDAEPGEVFAAEKGKQVRVPVGIGTVVPTDELIRLLEMPDLRRLRDESKAAQERAQASAPDLRGT